ncbi:MAG: sugar ABC transporter permease [Rhodobacter sp.]|nr:sugar ABC transporter permease [Rhodobacter sp.]MCA3462367.1 sugar ABC transporter permease [Rhodobacter sp.]MCA3463830.1 sugar ABC transporter permease [Rhodobacter sp.]MCA3466823.1 sugar ABC transporter permease [Rhodobacter sp.]MCA3470812.1 sugar ABC transporter permease [Rhodobacter sp.]
MTQALLAFLTIVVGVAGCLGYFWASNLLLDKVLFPARGPNAGQNINRANLLRPWLFLFPAVVALGLYLAYPVFATLWLSLNRNQSGELVFVGLDNYRTMFGEAKFRESLRNNMVWLIVVPAASTAFGLLAAQLTDRIRWGNLAKSMIFMPMAISFVGASVIWKLIYDTREAGQPQIGLLNALWMQADGGFFSILILKVLPVVLLVGIAAGILWFLWAQIRDFADGGIWGKVLRGLGVLVGAWLVFVALSWAWGAATAMLPYGKPQFWLQIPFWNNFFLMAVLIWLQTGFAMVILSAALRGVPEETVEAAILDGANPFQIFFKIKVPQIMGTIVVVWTTITITVLKVFDIVRAMTGGQQETQVLANYMYEKLFVAVDWGVGSASAMIILLLVSPILVWNVYSARKEMR